MKIVSLLGSPRKNANSSAIAEIITDSIQSDNKEIINHNLNQLTFKGCQACMACKGKSEICILKDDLTQVLEDVTQADIIIMATPVYWGDVSAQLKGFIDRSYSYLNPNFMDNEVKHRLPAGKKFVFIQTQGAPDEMYDEIFGRYNFFFEFLNYFEETHYLRACNQSPDIGVAAQPELVKEAQAIGEKLSEAAIA